VKLPGPERAKRVKYVFVGIIPNFYIVVTVFFFFNLFYHSVVLWLLFFFNKCIPLFSKDASKVTGRTFIMYVIKKCLF